MELAFSLHGNHVLSVLEIHEVALLLCAVKLVHFVVSYMYL